MEAILKFFVRFAPVIYILLAAGFLFGIQRLVRARTETRAAVYGLELEIAHHHMSQAIASLLLVGFLMIAELVLAVFLAPNLPALSLVTTPTMDPLAIPTNMLLSLPLSETTPGPTLGAQTIGCIPDYIMLTSPKPGEEIRNQISLQGTADIPNFGFYKYEFSPLGVDFWSTIQAGNTVVQDGELGFWDTSAITPGDYQLRLVVTDNQGNALPACVVPVRILAP
jgi:hypothetical protein